MVWMDVGQHSHFNIQVWRRTWVSNDCRNSNLTLFWFRKGVIWLWDNINISIFKYGIVHESVMTVEIQI